MSEGNGGFQKDNPEFAPKRQSADFEKEWQNVPHEELVLQMRKKVAGARASWETRHGKDTFDPVEWVSTLLNPIFRDKDTRTDQKRDLAIVWDAISEPHLKHQSYRHGVREDIYVHSQLHNRHVTLSPEAVKLIDVMTDALNIPHERGQATYDILKNFPQAKERKTNRLLSYIDRWFTEPPKPEKEEPKPQEPLFLELLSAIFSVLTDKPENGDRNK